MIQTKSLVLGFARTEDRGWDIHWYPVYLTLWRLLFSFRYPVSTGIFPHSLPEWTFRARPGLWRIGLIGLTKWAPFISLIFCCLGTYAHSQCVEIFGTLERHRLLVI